MKAILTNIKSNLALSMLAANMNSEIIYIQEDEYQNTIEQLLKKQPRKYKAITTKESILILFNFTSSEMDDLFKKLPVSFDLKAIVTSTNVKWTVLHLLKELRKEDQYMKGK